MTRRRRDDCAFVCVDVIKLGPSSLLGLAYTDRFTSEKLPDFTLARIQISRNDGMFGADDYAGRLQADFCSMRAKMAFRRGTVIRIDVDGVVRAGLHTCFAANTALGAEVDNSVFALVHRGHGADRDTGW